MWMMEAEDTNRSSESPSGVQIYENQEQPMSSKHYSEEEEDQEPKQDDDEIEEREKLFEKPLTPSDVGKLNRLVIPKHHAEKFFPLDSANNKKGLLLSFEDSMGKDWRFRYSYWNSSQSYVLTKGWSRFVKEKKLDAGDVVSFGRRIGGERFYINWNRHQNSRVQPNPALWNRFLHSCYRKQNEQLFYLRAPDAGLYTVNAGEPVGSPSTPSRSKRLRLFGVNLDCSTEPVEPDGSDGGVQSAFKFVRTAGSSSSSSSMAIDFDL